MGAVTAFFAAGIIGLQALLLLFLTGFLVHRYLEIEAFSSRFKRILDLLQRFHRELLFLVALSSVSGSLYLSKVLEMPPCELCWYQRILIFPVPLLLGVAIFLDKETVADYVLPLTVLGIPVAVYHYMMQWTVGGGACSTAISCSAIQVQEFGYVTVPMMSLTFFAVATVLMMFEYRGR